MTSLRVVSLVFRGHDLRKIANINPQQEAPFCYWKKLVPRESTGNGAQVLVKALRLTCVRSHTSRQIKNATISQFSTFLKSSKSREHFLLRLTLFYPIYGYLLRLKIVQWVYWLSAKFLAFYAYRLTPLRPSSYSPRNSDFVIPTFLNTINYRKHSLSYQGPHMWSKLAWL